MFAAPVVAQTDDKQPPESSMLVTNVSIKAFLVLCRLPLAVGVIGIGCFGTQAQALDARQEQDLQRVIDVQQRQLEAQQQQIDAQLQMLEQIQSQTKSQVNNASKEIERLGHLVKEQQQQLETLQQQVNPPPRTAAEAQTAQVPRTPASRPMTLPEGAKTTASGPVEKVVTSNGGERVKLAISGHINRMVNIVGDGKDTEAYFVDNDNSESRIRFAGTAEATDDLTLGAVIELSIAPNKSGNVSQLDKETDNIFDQRKTELTLDSKRFGKLFLGKGDTASYTTTSVDLSRTGVIAYATIADTAGGMLFREKDTGTLTDVRIGDAFNALDGLSRKNRVRYDTPEFYYGFRLATSAASDQRYDGALWWSGQGYGFKAAGAAAIAIPNEDDTGLQYDGSFSVLHEDTGLNLTLAGGLLKRDDQGNSQNTYAKLGWLTKFFDVGDTAFSIDYTRSLNFPTDSDDGYSVGAAAVQQFDEYGTELYFLYRLHSLDRDLDPSVHDINVGTIGARVKF